jgi:hypothetical protein
MFGPTNQPSQSQVQITLDGKQVEINRQNVFSLPAIRAQLETLALRQRRILFGLTIDGTPVKLSDSLESFGIFRMVSAVTISMNEVGRHMIWLASDQMDKLRVRVENLSLLVMINDDAMAQRLWWELLPDLKAPLMTLNHLPQFLEKTPTAEVMDSLHNFADKTQELRNLLVEIDELCNQHDLFGFSEALEKRLARWLAEMAVHLGRLYEKTC